MSYAAETQRLWLERMTVEDHLEDFHELWNNEEALIWSAQTPKKTVEESHAFMLTTLPSAENPNIDKFAILLKPVPENHQHPEPLLTAKGKAKMVGMVGTNRDSPHGLETGYCLNVKYWGRGYAGEAFAAFLELFWKLDERKDIMELVAKLDPGNVASQRIVKRVGATRGVVLKDWYARAIDGGEKRDIECWYITRPGTSVETLREGGTALSTTTII